MPHMKLKVVVCGGGIAGLTFALAMAKYPDVSVDIYDAASAFSPIGAGIGVWPRVWKILSQLGLDGLAEKTPVKPSNESVHAFTFRKSDEPEGIEFYNLLTKGHYLTFQRSDFQHALLNNLPPGYEVHYSRRLVSYSRRLSGDIEIVFQDGTTATCDLLVGADGLKSAVRTNFLQKQAEQERLQGNFDKAIALEASCSPFWVGTEAYRGLIPVEAIQAELQTGELQIPKYPTQFVGKNANVVIYPVANGTRISVVAVHARPNLAYTVYDGPWVKVVEKEELLSLFKNWEPQVGAWLRHLENPSKWAIHAVRPLPSFVSNGVVLIGDAAHAMAPHQGSGAGQAIEDAYFLAALLGHSSITSKTLDRALAGYDEFRRPFATNIAERSLLNGKYFTFNHDNIDFEHLKAEEKNAKLNEVGEAISDNWKWTWSTTLDGSLKDALEKLDADENSSVAMRSFL